MIKTAKVRNYRDGNEKALSNAEIIKLDKLLRYGIIETKGGKWKQWKSLKIILNDNTYVFVPMYKRGRLKIDKVYYKIKDSHISIFEELFRSGFKRK